MTNITRLKGLLVVAADGAEVNFVNEEGEVTHTISLPIGRHDLSRYSDLLEFSADLVNVKVVASGNASDTMSYPVATMLKSAANQNFRSQLSGMTHVERRYATEISQRISQNRKRREEQAGVARAHSARVNEIKQKRIDDEELENEQREERVRLIRRQKLQKEIDNDPILETGKPKLESADGANSDREESAATEQAKISEPKGER